MMPFGVGVGYWGMLVTAGISSPALSALALIGLPATRMGSMSRAKKVRIAPKPIVLG